MICGTLAHPRTVNSKPSTDRIEVPTFAGGFGRSGGRKLDDSISGSPQSAKILVEAFCGVDDSHQTTMAGKEDAFLLSCSDNTGEALA